MKKIAAIFLPILLVVFVLFSCKEKKTNNLPNSPQPPVKPKKDSTVAINNAGSPPIINIIDTIAPKKLMLYVSDSAATSERISIKITKIFDQKLADCIKKQKIQTDGHKTVWFKTNKAPFFFEAGTVPLLLIIMAHILKQTWLMMRLQNGQRIRRKRKKAILMKCM